MSINQSPVSQHVLLKDPKFVMFICKGLYIKLRKLQHLMIDCGCFTKFIFYTYVVFDSACGLCGTNHQLSVNGSVYLPFCVFPHGCEVGV